MKIVAVIPARYNSSRMPGKPLMDICEKPMIWWVYQQVQKCCFFSDVIVATDNNKIEQVCKNYSMKCLMTGNHDTPTSRLCEITEYIESDRYMLVMGDEPLLDVNCFQLFELKDFEVNYDVAVLTNILNSPTEVIDYSNQKIVMNKEREILMISRSPIPYPKGTLEFQYEKVTGVQLFSKKALDFYKRTVRSNLEIAEENDLIRFIEHGIKVKAVQSTYKTISVDTIKDLEMVRKICKKK